MKVKDILKALEGAPADAGVLLSIRGLKVEAPTKKVATSGKKETTKSVVVKKNTSKPAKPTAKPIVKKTPVAKKAAPAKKTGGKK